MNRKSDVRIHRNRRKRMVPQNAKVSNSFRAFFAPSSFTSRPASAIGRPRNFSIISPVEPVALFIEREQYLITIFSSSFFVGRLLVFFSVFDSFFSIKNPPAKFILHEREQGCDLPANFSRFIFCFFSIFHRLPHFFFWEFH